MKLTDLNRDGGIGANSFLVRLGSLNLIVDCGLHPKRVGRAALPARPPLQGQQLDLIIVTHCHLDHLGSLPVLMREHPETPALMSTASRILAERMLHNSASVMMRQREDENILDYPLFTHEEIDRCARRFTGIPFGQTRHFRGSQEALELILHFAGHIAGAAGVEIRHLHRRIFFTGDVLFESQHTLAGARFPFGPFDTLVLETTRGATARPPGYERNQELQRLLDSVNVTIQRGGSYLIPVFALGRMQEILTVLHEARRKRRLVDCPIYVSGLGVDLANYFHEIARKTSDLQFNRGILKQLQVRPLPRKVEAGVDPRQNALYVVSSGMLVERTPSYALTSGLLGHARNTIGFVGYCDPDTPGGHLLAAKSGDPFLFKAANVKARVAAKIERFQLSGHADREELLDFAVRTGAGRIILTHGDPEARAWFAAQLAERAPETLVVDPVPLQTYDV